LARDKDEREKRLNGIRRILAAGKDQATPQWYVNEQGQTMVVIPGPVEFVLGSDPTGRQYDHELFPLHRKRIGRSYAIASKEVTVANIRRFRQDLSGVPGETADWPASVTWHEAAAYCNWLSQQEGIPEKEWCYLNVGGDHRRLAPDYLQRTGYRLPNEAEWEYACRAGAVTSRYYGETEELMERYAWSKENSQRSLKAVGNLKPNDLGLFDMLGNAGEWCQEQYDLPPGRLGSEDVEDKRAVVNINRRVLRGAYFNYERESLNSYYRFPYFPMYRATGNGFRVARTFR